MRYSFTDQFRDFHAEYSFMLAQSTSRTTMLRPAATTALAVALAVALTVSGRPASGQPSAGNAPLAPFTTVYLSAGTLLLDVSKLNPHFERTDLPVAERPGFFTISDDGFSVGIGGYGAVHGKLTLGGEWNSADLGEEASPSGKTNQLTTSHWMANVGYGVYTSWRVNVVPSIGLGTGTVTLTLKDRDGGPTVPDTQDPTIDEIILSPGALSKVTGSYVIVQPAVAIDFLILRQTTSRMGVTLGLRMASAISPNRTSWKYKGREVFGGPDVGPTGGVIRVALGVGGFRMGDGK